MPEIAFVNGKFLPIEKAVVPVEDRGYQFGDAVYEGIASYNGRLFCLEAHLDRLERSMRALAFPAVSRDEIRAAVLELLERSGISRAFIYLQISRGVAPRNHAVPESAKPQIVMTLREINEIPESYRQKGVAAITLTDFRWTRCDIKTVQLLPNVIARQRALEKGVHDAIFVAKNDVVREATGSNVFIVAAGNLITHPLTTNILPGITRDMIIGCCEETRLPVSERYYSRTELYDADEVFLTGTTTEVLPVVNVDGNRIGEGTVGPISLRLLALLRSKCNKSE